MTDELEALPETVPQRCIVSAPILHPIDGMGVH